MKCVYVVMRGYAPRTDGLKPCDEVIRVYDDMMNAIAFCEQMMTQYPDVVYYVQNELLY